jgi:hypothetical protein
MERGKVYRGVVWEKAVGNITCIRNTGRPGRRSWGLVGACIGVSGRV